MSMEHPDKSTLMSEGWLQEAPQNVAAKMRRRHLHIVRPPLPPEPERKEPTPVAAPRFGTPPAPILVPRHASTSWWEEPLAVGVLLLVAPPVGLAALWASQRYERDARVALTVMTAFSMCLLTVIAVAR